MLWEAEKTIFSDLSMTKNENFKISDLLKSFTDYHSEFNVRFFSTEVLLTRLSLSFSIIIDLLILRLVLFLKNYLWAHRKSGC